MPTIVVLQFAPLGLGLVRPLRPVLLIDELAGRIRQNAEKVDIEDPSQAMEVMVAEEILVSEFG